MSESKGFCWCGMCGYHAILKTEDPDAFEKSDTQCPWCKEAGDFTLLNAGAELDESVIPDEPMMTWPATEFPDEEEEN